MHDRVKKILQRELIDHDANVLYIPLCQLSDEEERVLAESLGAFRAGSRLVTGTINRKLSRRNHRTIVFALARNVPTDTVEHLAELCGGFRQLSIKLRPVPWVDRITPNHWAVAYNKAVKLRQRGAPKDVILQQVVCYLSEQAAHAAPRSEEELIDRRSKKPRIPGLK